MAARPPKFHNDGLACPQTLYALKLRSLPLASQSHMGRGNAGPADVDYRQRSAEVCAGGRTGTGFEPVTFRYEDVPSLVQAIGQILAAQPQFRNRGADHRR